MLFAEHLVVLRGGGDLATGAAFRLRRAGFPVAVTELAEPLTVRRKVALSSAVAEREIDVEGVVGRRVDDAADLRPVASTGVVPVLVSPELPDVGAAVVVDARVAKRNLDTTIDDAPLVVALGPGFVAGQDCHAVVETMRGHRLGRVLWRGAAEPDTGTPGTVAGHGVERVLRAPEAGQAEWHVEIGDVVAGGRILSRVGHQEVVAPFDGVVRGLTAPTVRLRAGQKIGDVDPRGDPELCEQISDKALAVGGGVLEAVLTHLDRR